MMSEAQHTPGPWSTDPDTMHQSVLDANGVMVADCAIFGIGLEDSRSDRACEENARLIAAAPDLLGALEAALEEIKAWRNGLNTRNMNTCKVGARFSDMGAARAAIAKARGEG